MIPLSTSRSRWGASAAVAGVALAALLAACGGSAKASTGSSSTSSPANGNSPAAGAAGPGAGFQGTSGSVAAISGSSMEVQNAQSGQTTVDWTSATTFLQSVKVAPTALTSADCVTATGAFTNGTMTATAVTVTPLPASGTCASGFGARAGAGGFRRPTGSLPAGTAPSGSAARRFAGGSVASGRVVRASTTSLEISGHTFAFRGGARRSGSTSTTTTTPATDITIALTPSTIITEQKAVASSNLAIGDCVLAAGPSDSTGAVTARSVHITSTGGGTCSPGFARGFGGAGGAAPGATPAAGATQ